MATRRRPAQPAVHYVGSASGPWRIEFIEPEAVRNLVGARLFALFMKCFVGADRIVALDQLLRISRREQGIDSPEALRNQMLAFWLIAGTMHELGSALQELCSAKVVMKMRRKRAVWGPLNKLRAEWNTSVMGSLMRNQLGHHLGETQLYEAGISEAIRRRPRRLRFLDASGSAYHDGRYMLAWDAIHLGLNIEVKDLSKFMGRTKKAHEALPERLTAAFFEVLRTVGVPVEDRRSEP
jgi:hypothetical protein